MNDPASRPRWNYETRILAGALLTVAPALLALAIVLWVATGDFERTATWWSIVAIVTLGLVLAVRRKMVYPLYTLANLLEALREGD